MLYFYIYDMNTNVELELQTQYPESVVSLAIFVTKAPSDSHRHQEISNIFTLSNSSSCRPSQMTLPTVENSRLEDFKVDQLFWFHWSLSLRTWDSACLHTPVQTGQMPRRPWGKYMYEEKKWKPCINSPCHSAALWRECGSGAPQPGIKLESLLKSSDRSCVADFYITKSSPSRRLEQDWISTCLTWTDICIFAGQVILTQHLVC